MFCFVYWTRFLFWENSFDQKCCVSLSPVIKYDVNSVASLPHWSRDTKNENISDYTTKKRKNERKNGFVTFTAIYLSSFMCIFLPSIDYVSVLLSQVSVWLFAKFTVQFVAILGKKSEVLKMVKPTMNLRSTWVLASTRTMWQNRSASLCDLDLKIIIHVLFFSNPVNGTMPVL